MRQVRSDMDQSEFPVPVLTHITFPVLGYDDEMPTEDTPDGAEIIGVPLGLFSHMAMGLGVGSGEEIADAEVPLGHGEDWKSPRRMVKRVDMLGGFGGGLGSGQRGGGFVKWQRWAR